MINKLRYPEFFIRLFLGIIFLWAAYGKIVNPQAFVIAVENYQIFSLRISRWIAIGLPFMELLIGLFLIAGFWLKESFILTIILYLGFDAMILQAYFRGLDLNCGCFSTSGGTPIDIFKIIENAFLTGAAFLGFFLYKKRSSE